MLKIKKSLQRIKKLFIFLLLFCAFAYPHQTAEYILIFLESHGNIAFFALISFLIVQFSPFFWKEIKLKNTQIGEYLHGIPIPELLDHLFSHGSLKAKDTAHKWNLHPSRYSSLTKKLLSSGVLIKGEKNSNILNPNISREETLQILKSHQTERKSFPIFRRGTDEKNRPNFKIRTISTN